MRPSRPATLIIHTTSKKALRVRFQQNPPTLNRRWVLPVLPVIPPIIKLSSSSVKHLFLFLFNMGDSIKAAGSNCCNTQASAEMSENVTLAYWTRKNSLHFFLSFFLFIFFFFLWKYRTNKTCIPGPEMLQRAHVCWDGL